MVKTMSMCHRHLRCARGPPGLSPGSLEEPSEPAESEDSSDKTTGVAPGKCVGASGTGFLSSEPSSSRL
ncbi:hypothetical protein F6X56_17880 [Rhodococcus erythropolis]|nr:hypothetical protein C1M55_15450 [Rhodococcus qingshengii]OKA15447.1 hypothetical protein BS618_08520 [Rhodococcus erythropolis]ORC26503.1 hypothetical protein BXO91_09630 [Rhodococcus qingshengii]QEX11459.1 hypothetical protein F6X56_17880 [Rhodococcus erythropolis]THJ64408.1 hypothetical protein EU244_33900 [Rhodococcus qingshengii]